MPKPSKIRASQQKYVSPTQGVLPCFEMPFFGALSPDNRWVVLAGQLPWDALVKIYQKQMNNDKTGAGGINPRVVLGSLIIKHICDLSDRETIQQIRENVYMQYFIGYSGFSQTAPFDASLFVDLRKRLGMEAVNAINERIVQLIQKNGLHLEKITATKHDETDKRDLDKKCQINEQVSLSASVETLDESVKPSGREMKCEDKNEGQSPVPPANSGKMIIDATVCPQDIAYPTDLNLLNDAREKSEELIDFLYQAELHGKKPRTYRRKARKLYLGEAQKKSSSAKSIRKANGKQLAFLKRNIGAIHRLLDKYQRMPFDKAQYKYFLVIQTLYEQQEQMHRERLRSVEHRIVSIHQPHVRPIVRGKRNAKVEFGSKIQVNLMNGFVFMDDLEWEAFNEGGRLMSSVEKYCKRMGFYPAEVLADKIYCTRENRRLLKEMKIRLRAKPLGRTSACAAVDNHVRPGERNPIEGVFGQGKTAYGMNRIKARLARTSESWIATILMVINLVKITGLVRHALMLTVRTFLAWDLKIFEVCEARRSLKINWWWAVKTSAIGLT
jgi:hypothetical protein